MKITKLWTAAMGAGALVLAGSAVAQSSGGTDTSGSTQQGTPPSVGAPSDTSAKPSPSDMHGVDNKTDTMKPDDTMKSDEGAKSTDTKSGDVSGSPAAQSDKGASGQSSTGLWVSGKVANIDSHHITVRSTDGSQIILRTDKKTKVMDEKQNKEAISDLKEGDQVRAAYDLKGKAHRALRIEVVALPGSDANPAIPALPDTSGMKSPDTNGTTGTTPQAPDKSGTTATPDTTGSKPY